MPDTPNLIVIICDDLAYGDLSLHGNPHVQTPRLDAMAKQGVQMTRWCSGPLCTPARAALMTGRHPYRTRAIDTYLGRSMLDPTERTIAQDLADAGRATGIFGKWHLGDEYPLRAQDFGFQQSLVHRGGGLGQPANLGRDSYFDPDLMRDGQLQRVPGYCTEIFTDATIRFIDKHHDQPFFAYLAFNAPHTPLEVSEPLVAPFREAGIPETFARIYAMVVDIDRQVGRVLDALSDRNLDENTLVIFTSDHGPCPSSMHHNMTRWNAGLRAAKGTMYEGGIRVPSFWRWPGTLTAGQEVLTVTNPIDLRPTVASLFELEPTTPAIDGLDLSSRLLGSAPADAARPEPLVMQWHRGDTPEAGRNAAVITERWKWYSRAEYEIGQDPADEAQLFDLLNDPHETRDVLAEHPDVATALSQAYDGWFKDVSSTRENNYAPPRITAGHDDAPETWLTWQDWRLYEPANEGWSADKPGYWELRVHQPGPYELLADLPEREGEGFVLHVRATGLQTQVPVADRLKSLSLPNLELTAGAQRFEVYLESPAGSKLGVTRACLRRSAKLA